MALVTTALLAGAPLTPATAAAAAGELTELHVLTTDGGTVTRAYLGTSLRAIGSTHKIASRAAPGYMLERWVNRWGQTVSHQRTLVHTVSADPYLNVFSAHFVPSRYPEQAGAYSGLVYDADASPLQASGQATFTITPKGSISGRVIYLGTSFRFSGPLDGQSTLRREYRRRGGDLVQIEIGAETGVISVNGEMEAVISYQRLVYSAKNPMPEAETGRFNLTAPDPDIEQEEGAAPSPPALITLDIQRTGRVRYIACSPWGEKITGSSIWGTGEYYQLYSFKGGAHPRHIAGQAWFDTGILHLDLDTGSFKTSPPVHVHTHLSGRRHTPVSLRDMATQIAGVELTYTRPGDLPPGSQTWSLSAKGSLQPQSPPTQGPRPRLKLHRPTGLWTGTLQDPALGGRITFLALSTSGQARGLWTAPDPQAQSPSPTPLRTQTGAVQLQFQPIAFPD